MVSSASNGGRVVGGGCLDRVDGGELNNPSRGLATGAHLPRDSSQWWGRGNHSKQATYSIQYCTCTSILDLDLTQKRATAAP